MKYYTGIGSRKAPREALIIAAAMAELLVHFDYVLRSGGADGMDTAFELKCDYVDGKKEIYLPWKQFNKNPSDLYSSLPEAFTMAKEFHPNWESCSPGARKLHARNMHQILGKDLNTPSRFVICYTDPEKGGTTQALRLAEAMQIPIINLWEYDSSLWDMYSDDGRCEIIDSVLKQVLVKKHKLKPKMVVNIKNDNHYDVYIGRGSIWGNPFRIGEYTREQSIEKYRQYAHESTIIKNNLHKLKGKVLGCYCKPLACHGDVLIEMLKGE